jgi:hypothetical protein
MLDHFFLGDELEGLVDLPALLFIGVARDEPVREVRADERLCAREVPLPPVLSLKLGPVEGAEEDEESGGVVGKPVMCVVMYAATLNRTMGASLAPTLNIAWSHRGRSSGSSMDLMNVLSASTARSSFPVSISGAFASTRTSPQLASRRAVKVSPHNVKVTGSYVSGEYARRAASKSAFGIGLDEAG